MDNGRDPDVDEAPKQIRSWRESWYMLLSTRKEAIAKLNWACSKGSSSEGTNLDFVRAVSVSDAFVSGERHSRISLTLPSSITATVGHGIPKSGPMDSLSARVANLLVGNPEGKEVLEITILGPEVLSTAAAVVAICGADVRITIDGGDRPMRSTLVMRTGQALEFGQV
ncbi:hypothetical protein DL546_001282 [Coniochaeta pulveracea]|uniref:Carboxyltransferase domain-containing protein n=1 Tax=Coniochaeta pulveracea TaxID=177199 RepID=A0A420XW15_9PEZI|nr:hypothetical protein DL546_001282 [Coniochaeta pulveracea]